MQNLVEVEAGAPLPVLLTRIGVKAIIVKPDDVQVEMTFTFTIAQWKKVREALKNNSHSWSFPMSDIQQAIVDISNQVEKTFYPKEPTE